MDSNIILSNSTGIVNTITSLGTYSLNFDFSDLASNNLEGVKIDINII